MKRLFYILFSALLLVSVPAGFSPLHASERQGESLKDWQGTWNNFYSYFDRPELDEAYEILARREGKTASEVKRRYAEGKLYQCEIAAMRIDGQGITFYTRTQNSENSRKDVLALAKYKYIGKATDNFDRQWAHFEAVGAAPYKHLFLSGTEADAPGKTMFHFHFRYGDEVEKLKAAKGWFPTMVQYDSDLSLLVGHMTFED